MNSMKIAKKKFQIFKISNLNAYLRSKHKIRYFGTSVLNPGAGFLHIFTVAFDILG